VGKVHTLLQDCERVMKKLPNWMAFNLWIFYGFHQHSLFISESEKLTWRNFLITSSLWCKTKQNQVNQY